MATNTSNLQLESEAGGPSFAALKTMVRASGLLDRQPVYYAIRIPATVIMLAAGIAVLAIFDNLWIQLANAGYMAVAFTQIAFVGHDCGHRQIFRKAFWNDVLALACVPMVGIGYSWWWDTHNRHHSSPNEIGADPAIEYDLLAFSGDQALQKGRFARWLLRFQSFYFVPVTLFYPILMRVNSTRHLLSGKAKYATVETALLLLHFPLYLGMLFWLLPFWTAVLFLIAHQCLFGLFLVSAFAPNHKGMPVLEADHELDFLHQQILTSQNLQSSRWADFWFGGLNHQIEHHLFPHMPRNKLRKARAIIKSYCQEHAIPYQEARAPGCYWELLKFMHQAAAPVRRKRK